jgi:hypothetical protein
LDEWNQAIEENHIEDKIKKTQDCFAEYFGDFEKREKESFQQDLLEECRRVMEGRLQPNASHIAYWNGVMRLDDTVESVQGETLIIADLLRGMNRPDYVSIAQVRPKKLKCYVLLCVICGVERMQKNYLFFLIHPPPQQVNKNNGKLCSLRKSLLFFFLVSVFVLIFNIMKHYKMKRNMHGLPD